MTPFEIATTVRCSDSHIYELSDLPCFCVGRHYRILKTDAISCFQRLVPHMPLDSVLENQHGNGKPLI